MRGRILCTEPFWNAIKRSTVKHDAAAAVAAIAAATAAAIAAASLLRKPCYALSVSLPTLALPSV